ncbi:metalloproteinase inhibitor 2-like [Vanacampus margaritifer]
MRCFGLGFLEQSTMSWKNLVLPLVLLCWGLQEEGAQACTCLPVHPQQVFCQKDVVVIKAKVIGVMPGTHVEERLTKYDIEQTKNLKGSKLFAAIYTPASSAACGVTLTKGTEYLLMGRLQSDGMLHISACDIYQPWDALGATQKKLLYWFYKKGCDCTIKSCFSYPCCMTSPTECLWTDHMSGKSDQARSSACIKTAKGCCTWHRE